MEEVITALEGFAYPENNQQRIDCEIAVRELRKQNPKLFLFHMSECLNNKDVKTNARFVAGILFKNTVLNTSKDEVLDKLWFKMSGEERDTMKRSLFKALVCNNKNVMRSAGFAISAVAVLEIPNGQSLDIIDILYENSRHHLDNIKEVSLSTFKYICEDISSKDLQKEQADLIVNTCVKLLKENSANPKNLFNII